MNNLTSNLKVIITGATGMVGEGVLHECLQSNKVKEVVIVNRKSLGLSHPKLKEILHSDFFNLESIEEQLAGFDACFFCLGVSSVGMKEQEFYHLTYDLTLNFAKTLCKKNNALTFCYISGSGTDSTEKGKQMWARVKGKTENELMKLSLKKVYNFRPGIIEPTKGLKNTLSFYKYLGWLLPILRFITPNFICSLKEIGNAMINVASEDYKKSIIEVEDIKLLAHPNS